MNLTAIITCKNRTSVLKYCLASINVCNPTSNVVLVDFGNSKPLRQIFSYPWLKIITVKNKTDMFHKSRALNIGIRNVKTDYTCLTDADQIFQPNFFNVVYSALKKNPDAFVRCKTYFSSQLPNYEINKSNWSTYRQFLEKVKSNAKKLPHGEGCCHGVRTKWLKEVKGYDEKYIGWGYEDKDIILRAEKAGFKMVWVDDVTSMIHLPHARNKQYFSFAYINKNRKRFENKRSGHVTVIANKNSKWGEL